VKDRIFDRDQRLRFTAGKTWLLIIFFPSGATLPAVGKLILAGFSTLPASPEFAAGPAVHFFVDDSLRPHFIAVVDDPEFRIALDKRYLTAGRKQFVSFQAGNVIIFEYVLCVRQLDR
jgi:hypothetical protein